MSSTLSGLDLDPLPPVESKDKKSPNRANAFNRCEDRADDPAPAAGAGDHAYADDPESQLSKPTYKLEEQKDPVRGDGTRRQGRRLHRKRVRVGVRGVVRRTDINFIYILKPAIRPRPT